MKITLDIPENFKDEEIVIKINIREENGVEKEEIKLESPLPAPEKPKRQKKTVSKVSGNFMDMEF